MATTAKRRKANIVKPAPVIKQVGDSTIFEDNPDTSNNETDAEKIKRLESLVVAQQTELEKKGAMPGWLITTPNAFYNGKTAGISFKGGRGFIAGNDEKAEKKAKLLCDDFGYERRFVQDFLSDADMAEQVGGSLVDVLLGSQVR